MNVQTEPDFDPYNFHLKTINVFEHMNVRVSELLGPDGEPLRIVRARHPIGFDLRPRHARGA